MIDFEKEVKNFFALKPLWTSMGQWAKAIAARAWEEGFSKAKSKYDDQPGIGDDSDFGENPYEETEERK